MTASKWLLLCLVVLSAVGSAVQGYHAYGYDSSYGSRYERVSDRTYVQSTESEFASDADYYGGYYRGGRNYNYGRSRTVSYGREFESERRDSFGSNDYGYGGGYGYRYGYDGSRYGYMPYDSTYRGYWMSQPSRYYPMYGYGFYD